MPGSRIESHRCFPLLLIAASLAASGLSILRDPLLIALLHGVTGWPLLASAHLLDGAFIALLVSGFAHPLGLVYCVLLAWGIATRCAAIPEHGRVICIYPVQANGAAP